MPPVVSLLLALLQLDDAPGVGAGPHLAGPFCRSGRAPFPMPLASPAYRKKDSGGYVGIHRELALPRQQLADGSS